MEHWKERISRIAAALGLAAYDGGPLAISFPGFPDVCLELVGEGQVLAAHVDLGDLAVGVNDAEERLARLLEANAPQYIEAGGVAAIDGVTGGCTLFCRFEDASISDDELADQLRQLAEAARRKRDELQHPAHAARSDGDDLPMISHAVRV